MIQEYESYTRNLFGEHAEKVLCGASGAQLGRLVPEGYLARFAPKLQHMTLAEYQQWFLMKWQPLFKE